MFFHQVCSGPTITPAASVIVLRQYGTFNGSGNFVSQGCYTCEMLLKVNHFAADKGKSLIWRGFTEAETIFFCVYGEVRII